MLFFIPEASKATATNSNSTTGNNVTSANSNKTCIWQKECICEDIPEITTVVNLVDCAWADWGSWADCTSTCKGGQQTRIRAIASDAQYGGVNCSQSACTANDNLNENCVSQTQQCNQNISCPGNYPILLDTLKVTNDIIPSESIY